MTAGWGPGCRCPPPRALGAAGSCRRRAPRGHDPRSASRWAIRGIRRHQGSISAYGAVLSKVRDRRILQCGIGGARSSRAHEPFSHPLVASRPAMPIVRAIRNTVLAVALLLVVLAACTGSPEPGPAPDRQDPSPSALTDDELGQVEGVPKFLVDRLQRQLAEELARPDQISLARQKIKHIVFIVKENRTFDHMFGRFPEADGATSGLTCDGERVPLLPAGDRVPEIDHGFVEGLVAINGGRMDCFDRLGGGEDLDSYLAYDREGIPNYWALAKHFTLADRFFSSIYGPTGVEHMWVIASQSDRFVDMERRGQQGTGEPRERCLDPAERAY